MMDDREFLPILECYVMIILHLISAPAMVDVKATDIPRKRH